MKLITKLHDLDEALSIKYDLEERGVPIHIGSENSGPAMGVIIAADCYTIWAELDSQYNCAIKAMNNKDYLVIDPVDVQELRTLQENREQEFRNSFSQFNEKILNIIVVVGLLVGIVYVVSHM